MRAVLVGNDYIKDGDGNFKHLESNTSILQPFFRAERYFDKTVFDQFITDNGLTEIVIIDPRGPNFVKDVVDKQKLQTDTSFQKICRMFANTYGDTLSVSILHQNEDGSLPNVEDATNKLILRIAYDFNALVDETYCKDNFNFLKLMFDDNPSSIPKTYFNDGLGLTIDTIGTSIGDNGNHPNFIIKERYPTTDYSAYPKVLKVNTTQELEYLKTNLGDEEILQEYICNTSDLSEGKLKTYRHLTILYGSDLSVLNVFDPIEHSNRIPLTSEVDYESGVNNISTLATWERPKYLQKTGNEVYVQKTFTGSEDNTIQLSDGSLPKLNQLSLGNVLSTVNLNGMELDDTNYVNYSSTITEINNDSQFGATTVIQSINSGLSGYFEYTINLSGGLSYNFLRMSVILSSAIDSNEFRFMQVHNLTSGCKILTKSLDSDQFIEETIESITYQYVVKNVYVIDAEEIDYYFRPDNSTTPTRSVIHHNAGAGICQCYYNIFYGDNNTCMDPCLYAPGECPDNGQDFIDCCSSTPSGGFGQTVTDGACGDSGKN